LIKFRVVRCFLCFILVVVIVGGLTGHIVLAQPETEPLVNCDYPVVPGESGDRFEFMINLKWYGPGGESFNLITTAPSKWIVATTKVYPEEEIGAIWMKEYQSFDTQFKVIAYPVSWYQPEPGEYMITLEAVSDDGERRTSLELTARVTAVYELSMVTSTGKLNIEAVAGEDNPLSLVLENTGTADISNITFSSSKFEAWGVIFAPEKIDTLEPGAKQEVEVVIKPPHNRTIAGDYGITLNVEGKEYVPDPLTIRVTILTPAVWNWIGILIVVIVVAGLVALFWRLSMR